MGDNEDLEIRFDNQSKPIDKIIQSSDLPTVLKYDKNQEVDPNLIGPGFDPDQTYLLHATHEITRILGRSAEFQPTSNSFEDSGLDVTVDEQYDGWFAVFGNPSSHRCDPVVPHFRSIGKLSINACQTFLVSGTQDLEAMEVIYNVDGSKSLKPFSIRPGAVLTKVGMYTVSLNIKIKRNLFKNKVIKKDENYLACRDEQHNEMLIPCYATGIFYELYPVSSQNKTPIMKMEEILSRNRFPVLVKLVHGHTVEMPPSCKGTFVLLKSEQMKTAFASTLYSPQPAIIELATDSSLRFYNFDASKVLDFEKNNNSSAFSKAYKNYADKMPSLLQIIRYRNNDQGLTSARSSSTSGHGSSLSDDEERFDWSKIAVCSNAPFIESINALKNIDTLFTLLTNSHPATFQTAISQAKDKKNKTIPHLRKQLSADNVKKTTVATAIKRTNVYDSPRSNKDRIPITTHRRASAGSIPLTRNRSPSTSSCTSSTTLNSYREKTHSPSSETTNSLIIDSQTAYAHLWSDNSSMASSESTEIEVENVTHTDESGFSRDPASTHEYKNLSAELVASVKLRNRNIDHYNILERNSHSEEHEEEDVENPYDLLSAHRNTVRASYHKLLQTSVDRSSTDSIPESLDPHTGNEGACATDAYDILPANPYRNTARASYLELLPPTDESSATDSIPDSFDVPTGCGNDGEYASDSLEDIRKRISMKSTVSYEEPNYRFYETPNSDLYETPQNGNYDITRTGTYEKPVSRNFDLPENKTYVNPETSNYDVPRNRSHLSPIPQQQNEGDQNDSYQDDSTIYESVENVYESIADIELPYPTARAERYMNLPSSDYMNTDNLGTLQSSPDVKSDYENTRDSTQNKPTNKSELFLNTPTTSNEEGLSNSKTEALFDYINTDNVGTLKSSPAVKSDYENTRDSPKNKPTNKSDLFLNTPTASNEEDLSNSKTEALFDYINTDNVGTLKSSPAVKSDYENTRDSPKNKPTNKSDLFLNTPTASNEDGLSNSKTEALLSNLKDLGLKPTTQEAIKSIDPMLFKSCIDDEADVRSKLIELIPGMNRIDLSKILLFLSNNVNS